jgi:ComF family protein
MIRWWQDLLNTVFPNTCLACHDALREKEAEICTKCRLSLPYTDHHLDRENEFWKKFSVNLPIEFALACLKFHKQGATQKIIHALKYYENQEIGKLLGRWYGTTLLENAYTFDLILPVPLHPSKRAKRGYNQSDCFAEGLAEGLQTDWSPTLLKRNKNTETQTRKDRKDRWANVAQIFEVIQPEILVGKRITIVDDVVTTGSTLDSCVRSVLLCEPKSVSLIAIGVAGEL